MPKEQYIPVNFAKANTNADVKTTVGNIITGATNGAPIPTSDDKKAKKSDEKKKKTRVYRKKSYATLADLEKDCGKCTKYRQAKESKAQFFAVSANLSKEPELTRINYGWHALTADNKQEILARVSKMCDDAMTNGYQPRKNKGESVVVDPVAIAAAATLGGH